MNHLKSLEVAWNDSKNQLNCFKYNILVLQKFGKNFCEYIRTENSNYKSENIKTKYLSNTWKTRFLKLKNNFLISEKYFIELKDRELKNREVKIKREIEELILNQLLCLQMISPCLIKKKWRRKDLLKTLPTWLVN